MIWNEKIECMERDELEELQLKRLQETVKRAFDKIPYYNKKYTENQLFLVTHLKTLIHGVKQ